MKKAFVFIPNITDKIAIALDLFSATRFEISERARLLLLVSAVESLTNQPKRSGTSLHLVEHFILMTEKAIEDNKGEQESLTRLKSTLVRECNESINRTCWDFINYYLGEDKANDFKKWYIYRSDLVHSGRIKKQIDLRKVVYDLDRLVRELLIRVISDIEKP